MTSPFRPRSTRVRVCLMIYVIQQILFCMVPRAGIEPALPREQDFKSCVSTNSTIWAKRPVTRPFLDDSLFFEGSESSC